MEYLLKFINHTKTMEGRFVFFNNWVTLVFPKVSNNSTKLGRWRNVSKGVSNSDVHDPGYMHIYHSRTDLDDAKCSRKT